MSMKTFLLYCVISSFSFFNYVYAANRAPILSFISDSGRVMSTGTIYKITFNATDIDKNLEKITVDWGDGTIPTEKNILNGKNMTFSHSYKTEGEFVPEIYAIDLENLESLHFPAGFEGKNQFQKQFPEGFKITIEARDKRNTNLDKKKLYYVKVCNSGEIAGEGNCPKSPLLGLEPDDWGCTKDLQTSLLWEIKTKDNGLRDWRKTYTHFGEEFGDNLYEAQNNTYGFIYDVNTESLCGVNNWRLPTKTELNTLIYCSSYLYKTDSETNTCRENTNNASPYIYTSFFPNTQNASYWSLDLLQKPASIKTPEPNCSADNFSDCDMYGGWLFSFNGKYSKLNGYSSTSTRSSKNYVRLVSGEMQQTSSE